MKAIIGGTGLDELYRECEPVEITTEYGKVKLFERNNLVFLPRHGFKHSIPPHLINYRANVAALKQLGVDEAVGIYSVGAITRRIAPGEVTLISDFIDFTGGNRAGTFQDSEGAAVAHVSMEQPFSHALQEKLLSVARKLKFPLSEGGIYVCTNGPRLESRAEIRMFSHLGGDFVGMTGCPEIFLMAEAGIAFAGIAYCINWASGIAASGIMFLDDLTIAEISKALIALCKAALA
ncbi:MAG: MTAP family purine nucleoside phosphorylase [Spirochaetia bacterium]|jgi:5'-methylthioadenosine phosphorylase|nr:MTAP family purine nucleoside phosphorylase [Spirochaetia bacterium]